MKKFTSILTLMLLCLGVMAQQGVALPHPSQMPPVKVVTKRPVPTHANHQRAAQPFPITVDFCHTDSVYYAVDLGGEFVDVYAYRLGSKEPLDSFHNGDFRWVGTEYDTLIDYATGNGYGTATTPTSVDSIQMLYSYPRASSASVVDTLFITIYKGPLAVNSNSVITSVVLHVDTVIMDTSMMTTAQGIGIFQVNPNYHFASPTKFAVVYDFHGDTTNHFQVIGGFGDICNNACAADLSSVSFNVVWNQINTFNPGNQIDNIGTYYFYPSCNNNIQAYDSTTCNAFDFQDLNTFLFATITPPLLANPTADKPIVCPGSTVNLSSNVSGGNAPFTYSWTSTNTGGVQNPSDANTGAVVVTNNPIDTITYTFKVVDGNNNSVTKSVTVLVKGISVNAGNDTTIGCGTTATLKATATGSLAGLTTQWTGPVIGSGLTLPGATPGKYVVTVSNNNSGNSCTAKDSVIVTLPITQTVNFSAHSLYHGTTDTVTFSPCRNQVDTFTNTSATTAGWTWTWTVNPGGLNGTTQDFSTTFPTPGVDTVTLVGDSADCELSKTRTVSVLDSTNVNCRTVIGINNIDFANLVSVYPNPTSGMFSITFTEINSTNVNLSVFDLVGRNVYTQNNFSVAGNETKSIDLGKNANGIYFVRIQVDGQPYTVRLSLNK